MVMAIYKLTVNVPTEALRAAHPYEEPPIDIIKLESLLN